jgi:uncharacterized protein YbcI
MSANQASSGAAAQEIARELLRVHEDSFGRTASNPAVAIHEGFIAVVMEVELSGAEQTLLRHGHGPAVRRTREEFAQAIAAVYESIVERATGRRVESFASRLALEDEPPWSADVFRLGPRLEGAEALAE